MKIKGIIFDMDGTIIDTNDIWINATKQLIISKKSDLDTKLIDNIIQEVHGLALFQACKLIKDKIKLEDSIEELIKQKSFFAKNLYKSGIKFINGFLEFHEYAKSKNLNMAIATNADKYTLNTAKNLLNIEKYFGNNIYDISCVNNICKPNPDIYIYAADKINLKPEECIAIEDSAHGIKAAKSAGIFCIGINSSENIENIKEADLKVNNYREIDLDKISLEYFNKKIN